MNTDIYLRPINIDDTENIVRWRNYENVKKYFIYQDTFTKEGHIKWIETKVKTGEVIQFMIIEKKNDRPIGSVYLKNIDRICRKAEFGIFLGEDDVSGKGYGYCAAKMILEYAFHKEKFHKIYLRVLADNERAIASYKKAGFEPEGKSVDDVFIKNEFRTIVWMAAFNPDEYGDIEW
jgi:UDP-4-amino-4,6-dideoxy-N-acetyl-beta-L-altrosamine N-acetyltransferase